jgi:hypothetical protein
LAPNTAQTHQDPLTQQQGGKFWTQDHAIQLYLEYSDLISGLRTGVEAILTKLCVAKSNWLYAVPSHTRTPEGANVFMVINAATWLQEW